MPKTAVISARIDPDLKHEAEEVFRELGLTATQAITLFYRLDRDACIVCILAIGVKGQYGLCIGGGKPHSGCQACRER